MPEVTVVMPENNINILVENIHLNNIHSENNSQNNEVKKKKIANYRKKDKKLTSEEIEERNKNTLSFINSFIAKLGGKDNFNKNPNGVAFIIIKGSYIQLVVNKVKYRNKGRYLDRSLQNPGGHIDRGENYFQAAMRELEEETVKCIPRNEKKYYGFPELKFVNEFRDNDTNSIIFIAKTKSNLYKGATDRFEQEVDEIILAPLKDVYESLKYEQPLYGLDWRGCSKKSLLKMWPVIKLYQDLIIE